jgi:glycosyltransferase involved in cell wall biosynthesis
MAPRVSIVVPVFNTEEYLALTLASLRRQTFDDLEIVCVDDGSLDRSGDILALAAAADPRVRVVRQANAGSSAARNRGIAEAAGEIIMFADADDTLDKDAAAKVVAAFDAFNPDIVTFGGSAYPESSAYPWLEARLVPEPGVYDGFAPELLFGEKARPFIWCSAFAAGFLRREGLAFDTRLVLGEDQVFNFAAFPVARRTVAIEDRLYEYRVSRRESLMSERHTDTDNRLHEHLAIVRTILAHWRERDWLTPHEGELLDWIYTFLLSDMLSQKPAVRHEALTALAELLGEFFAHPGPTVDPAAAALLATLKAGPADPYATTTTVAVTRFYFARHGLSQGLRRSVIGALRSGPARFARRAARRLLPAPASTLSHRLSQLQDRIDDAGRRILALDLLRAEAAAKAEPPA